MNKISAARKVARKNVQRYRDRMRDSGFRLVQFWVPDSRARGFAAECRRQSLVATKNKGAENEVMTWIESNDDADGWSR